jgi:CHRD domain-containing protein
MWKCGQRRDHLVMCCVIVAGTALAVLAPATSASRPEKGNSQGPLRIRAKLDAHQVPGGQEVKVPNATGLFTATLTGNKLSWTLTYRGLSGPALGAHIHIAKPGASHWEPVIGLCGFLADPGQPTSCRSGVHGNATVHAGTLYQISASRVRKAILNGGAYVNIHTTKNYNWGEIRGQIAVVK